MMPEDLERAKSLKHAFGHLVGSYDVNDPHHADSGELAEDILESLRDFSIGDIRTIAEHVSGNYSYNGEEEEFHRRVEAGEA